MRDLSSVEINAVSGGVITLKSPLHEPPVGFPEGPTPGTPLYPTDLSDVSAAQAACLVAAEALHLDQLQSDIACHTDLSGDNPNDPANASRLGEIVDHNIKDFLPDLSGLISDNNVTAPNDQGTSEQFAVSLDNGSSNSDVSYYDNNYDSSYYDYSNGDYQYA